MLTHSTMLSMFNCVAFIQIFIIQNAFIPVKGTIRTPSTTMASNIPFLPLRRKLNHIPRRTFLDLEDLRGGANAGVSMSYTKIGLINLSSRNLEPSTGGDYEVSSDVEADDDEDDTDVSVSLSFSIMLKWIARQFSTSNDDDEIPSVGNDMKLGSLIAIPSTATDSSANTNNEFKEASFLTSSHFTSDVNQDLCDTAETLGCLADAVIILYDTTCIHRQKALIRLIKGIERQRASAADKNDEDKFVDVFILAPDDALEELNAIRDVVGEGDEDMGDMMQIIPISRVGGELESLEDNREMVLEGFYEAADEAKDVPLTSFPLLVKAVYNKFGSTGQTGKKVMFQTNGVNIVEEEEEYDIEDQEEYDIEEEYDAEEVTEEEEEYDIEEEVAEKDDLKGIDEDAIEDKEEDIEEEIGEYDKENDIEEEIIEDEDEDGIEEEAIGEEIANEAILKEDSGSQIESEEQIEVQEDTDEEEDLEEEEEKDSIGEEKNIEEQSESEPEVIPDENLSTKEDSITQTPELNKKDDEEIVKEEASPVDQLSEELKSAVEEKIVQFTGDIEDQLSTLENKQDEVLLDDMKMPILEFGRDAGNILKIASKIFDTREVRKAIVGSIDKAFVEEKHKDFLSHVNENVRRLFENQLQSLREYYGRRYESVIEKLEEDDDGGVLDMDEEQLKQRRIKHDKILVEEAKKATAGFRSAAENAVPAIVRNGDLKEYGIGYTFEGALDGLIRDMMQATSDLKSLEDDWESVNTDISEGDAENISGKRRGPVKWYEKLAARVLVFGVNYLQGWLAYQGIKKAAEERDRMMPKFPLF